MATFLFESLFCSTHTQKRHTCLLLGLQLCTVPTKPEVVLCSQNTVLVTTCKWWTGTEIKCNENQLEFKQIKWAKKNYRKIKDLKLKIFRSSKDLGGLGHIDAATTMSSRHCLHRRLLKKIKSKSSFMKISLFYIIKNLRLWNDSRP